MANDELPPIVIKRVKKVVGGHHGGAWKVAYADFVTAMMAFFLLMWLLNATPAKTISGLAEYFAPTMGVKDKMGIGFKGGVGQVTEGRGKDMDTNKGLVFGAPRLGSVVNEPRAREEVNQEVTEKIEISASEGEDKKSFDQVISEVKERMRSNPDMLELNESVEMKQIPEGLMIQLVDKQGLPMFDQGTAKFTPFAEKILTEVSKVISLVPNNLSIVGHTALKNYSKDPAYTNWELSMDRANAARRFLVSMGVGNEQITKVVGRADQEPYNPQAPGIPENDRVSIILLKSDVEPYHKKPTPDAMFVDPTAADKDKYLSVNPLKKIEEEKKRVEDEKKKREEEIKQLEQQKKKESWNPRAYKPEDKQESDKFAPLGLE